MNKEQVIFALYNFKNIKKMKNKIISKISMIALVGLLFASVVGCDKKNAVTGVSLDKTTLSVEVGKTSQLMATVAPTDADDKTVTWSSSDATVASVSATGLVTGVKVSATAVTITVTTKDGAKTAKCAVTVTAAPVTTVAVTGVSLDKTTLSVVVGKTSQLMATVAPTDASDKTVTWKSSDATIASVSATGLVTGVKVSATAVTITVTTKDGAKTATCAVTVTADPGAVTGVKLAAADKADVQLAVNGTKKINPPTVEPTTATDKTVMWSSKDATIASVGTDGTVTAKKLGEVYILVSATSDATKKDSVKVSVVVPITSITFKNPSIDLRTTEKYNLRDAEVAGYLTIVPSATANRETPSIVSSDPTKVKIDLTTFTLEAKGAKGVDVATVTVKSNITTAATGSVKINITDYLAITNIAFKAPKTKTVAVNTTYTIAQAIGDGTLIVTPTNYNELINATSSDPTIVSVNLISKELKALKAGTVTITLTAGHDATIKDTITVTVQ